MREPAPDRRGKSKQRGAALMIMVAILVVAFATLLVGLLSYSAMNSARQERTAVALAQAKDALLGRAVSDVNMPGSLPCPDTNDDGDAEPISGDVCPNYIGRLPWRSLGLPDLRDGSNERLWYALSPGFRNHNPISPTVSPLNSNTKGTLLVYDTNGTTQLTQAGYSAVAVIFAPGSPLGPQTRNTVAERYDAANYLDAANGRDNSIVGVGFIAGDKSDDFNDQLLFITTHDLMPLVERRVAGVVKQALDDYYANSSGTPSNRYYPWADTIASQAEYDANFGENRGWIPYHSSASGTYEWYLTGSPPLWFFDNQWYTLIYYAVAPSFSESHNSGTLSVDGTSGTKVLFFMPGTYSGTRAIDDLTQYLEDAQNNDNANDTFVTPTSQSMDRDRLYYYSSSTWKP
jgi:hypothetical protein